ncbi:uncharacterized protein VICG_01631 [Vittaforma corneae ATCC 50505]|uniref:Uncharacterized protein n=1 Tax=Vittaforma corneae (strain ATCC 50505) TaxID=993615 RepID=L2GLL0_VITCO|nr:uncharacterized protein VICG_01631 [Vittaforma corneae ATCC 50505]ELA41390.1 hypothetical protein VICG_01631 [Vittaforma corneae ATCC 50505]
MIYEKLIKSIISEIRQTIKFIPSHRTILETQEYIEAYGEHYENADLDDEVMANDTQFHQNLIAFLNEITGKYKNQSLTQLRMQDNLVIVGTAYALLGKCHERGWFGVERDQSLAVEYFTRSAACKTPIGTFELARCFEFGKGTDVDVERACILYRASYKLGYIRGLHKYARILLKGNDFVERNILDGYYILKQAAVSKDRIYIAPYYDLAMLYKSRICDILNDNRYAFQIFLLGASKGCKYCQYKLGEEYEEGEIVDRNLNKAFYWYKMSAENNLSDAQLRIAEFLFGIRSGLKIDIDKAIKQEGFEGQVTFYNGTKIDNKYSLGGLELGMLKQRPPIRFGNFYGTDFNRFKEGYKMAHRSASYGKKEAILLVAEALEKGLGTEISLLESLWWYKIAEGLGCDNIRERMYLLEMKIGKKIF